MADNLRINIPELNSLRCIFMLMILFHHMNHNTLFPPGGYIAVAFFFVLSGFSMTIGYHDRVMQSNFSYRNYIVRRLIKFFPIHWLVILCTLVISFFLSRSVFSEQFFGVKLLLNSLLLQSFIPNKEFYFSFNGPSWYLCNTLFYCILFPFILKGLCRGSSVCKKAIFVVLVLVYALLVVIVPDEYRHAYLYISPFIRVLDFVFGIYAGLFFLHVYERGTYSYYRTILLVIVAFVFVVLTAFSFCNIERGVRFYTNYLYWIAFCPLVVSVSLLSMIKQKKPRTSDVKFMARVGRFFQWGGRFSFTFYMVHYQCIVVINIICTKMGFPLGITVILTVIVTMTVAIVCQKFFVEPIGKVLMNKILK